MTGRRPEVAVENVMKAIAMHPEPVVTASDIHEQIGLSKDGARERLKSLADDGYLGVKRPGSSALVFWMTDEGKRALSDATMN
jgi:predicted ArsR family transcriptional regulator